MAKNKNGSTKKAFALVVIVLLRTIGATAQTPTQEQIQQAQASDDRFFDS
jgi:hypothetical protein